MSKDVLSKRFDVVNFFYGFGAAVVLLAAMFKFNGVDYADTVFVAGTCMEILVFMISAFRWKDEEKAYKWENVFPELLEGSDSSPVRQESVQYGMSSIRDVSSSMARLAALFDAVSEVGRNLSQLTASLQRVNYSVSVLADAQEEMSLSSRDYRSELEKLSAHVRRLNARVDELNDLSL